MMNISKDLVAASAGPLVLAILAEGDSYGYAIIKRVGELSGGRLRWTDGMLYPVLHRLERLGYLGARWATAETGRRRPLLSHHEDRPGPPGGSTTAVAGGGRHPPRDLAGTHPSARSRIDRTVTRMERSW